MRPRRLILAIIILAVAIPAVALASAPPRPRAGKWKLSGLGGFTVSRNRKTITDLHIKPTPAYACGTAKITVLTKLTLRTTSRGGYTNWIIGRSTPHTSSGVSTVRVKLRQAGHISHGGMYLIFDIAGYTRDNSGYLQFGSCYFTLDVTKG